MTDAVHPHSDSVPFRAVSDHCRYHWRLPFLQEHGDLARSTTTTFHRAAIARRRRAPTFRRLSVQHIPIEYPFADVPAPGEPVRIAHGISWVRMPLPFDALDHINLWLLDDGDDLVIVDTGFGDDATREYWTRILAANGRRVTRIVVTHFHPDHLGQAAWLGARDGAEIHITASEYFSALAMWHQVPGHGVADMVAFFRRHGLAEERLAALEARGNTYRRGVPQLPRTHHRMIHDGPLTVGGRSWRIIIGHGHSPEHASLYCEATGVLIAGDQLLPRITPNITVQAAAPHEDSLAHFLSSLHRFNCLPENTLVLPSHGRPFRGIQSRTAQLTAHHAERCATILTALDTPKSAADLLPTLFSRPLDNHQVMFAMGEAIAHLNHLVQRGEVQAVEDDCGILRFARNSPLT